MAGRKKRRGGVILRLLTVVSVIAVLLFAASMFFRIKIINVVGTKVCAPENIIRESLIEEGEVLIFINKRRAISGIMSEEPYVESVNIKTILPSEIEIEVTETAAIGYFEYYGVYWLTDRRGILLEKTGEPPAGLIRIAGKVPSSPVAGMAAEFSEPEFAAALTDVLQILEKRMDDITLIDVTSSANIKFNYLGRFTVELGSAASLERKMKFLDGTIERLTSNEKGIIILPEADEKAARFIGG